MISVYEHPKIEYIHVSLIKKMVFVGDQERYTCTSLVTLFDFLVIKQILI